MKTFEETTALAVTQLVYALAKSSAHADANLEIGIDAAIASLQLLKVSIAEGNAPEIEAAALVALNPFESGCDFTLLDDQVSAWVTIGNISVYLKRCDEGVSVDLFPSGGEGEGSIASTYALFEEAQTEEVMPCEQ